MRFSTIIIILVATVASGVTAAPVPSFEKPSIWQRVDNALARKLKLNHILIPPYAEGYMWLTTHLDPLAAQWEPVSEPDHSMSHNSSSSFGEISLPEISNELWTQFCHDEPELSGGDTISAVSEQTETREEVASVSIEYEEDSNSSIWDQVSDIQVEDLPEIVEIREPTPPVVKKVVPFPPLYLILDKLFDELVSEDIEEAGMSLRSAGNLISKYKYNGALSVTNIVQPMWCEYKTFYNLIGLERRGPDRRLKEFEVTREMIEDNKVVEKKVTITVNQVAVQNGEQAKTRGLKIHERLEREVVGPPQITIRAKTKEEVLGVRLLNMITGLVALKKGGYWRELSVFGFIGDIPINGIIDGLRLEPSLKSNAGNCLRISDTKTKRANTRLGDVVPKEHRVQLMVYKQLLDGLLSPNFNWIHLFQIYNLDYLETFGDEFIATSIPFSESNELGKEAEEARNLEDLVRVWMECVQDLDLISGEVEAELSLEIHQPSSVHKDSLDGSLSDQSETSTFVTSQAFEYDEAFVQKAVSRSLEFWLATREHVGVDISETWKCDTCEYKQDCEWRAEQASRFSHKIPSKR